MICTPVVRACHSLEEHRSPWKTECVNATPAALCTWSLWGPGPGPCPCPSHPRVPLPHLLGLLSLQSSPAGKGLSLCKFRTERLVLPAPPEKVCDCALDLSLR